MMVREPLVVSICVVTNSGLSQHKHREEYLRRLLASVELAQFPKDRFEIIVAGALPKLPQNIRTLDLNAMAAQGAICALRNALVNAANGIFIVQCDDDIVFTKGYWSAVLQATESCDILCTRLLNPNGSRYWDWAAFVPGKGQTLLPYDAEDQFVYATGGHGVYRRSIFEEIKWDERITHGGNEEYQFAADARVARCKVEFCKEATVFLQYHHCDAAAVVEQRSQSETESICNEFRTTLAALDNKKVTVDEVVSEIVHSNSMITYEPNALIARLGHKLTKTANHEGTTVDVSIVTCCYRYLQRFRVFAQSICRQNFNLSNVEVVVANPHSPDGLSAYISLLKKTYQAPLFQEVLLDSTHRRNRGLLIQEAFKLSRGRVVIGMDCDLVLPPEFVQRVVETVRTNPKRVIGVYRSFLTLKTTAAILTGAIDPFEQYLTLAGEDQDETLGYRGVLGYCQATTREAWEATGYPIEFEGSAKSDVEFNERLTKIGVQPLFLRDTVVLHLNHERNWLGTDNYL
jgi:glycosyltransferase involved in cell wall biosynthesis